MLKKYENFALILLIFFFISFDYSFKNYQKNFKYELSWDEVDYVNAAKEGLIENALETNSKNFIEFIKIGYGKIYIKDKINIINQNDIIKLDKQKKDVFHLRHYHPPLLIYYLSFFTDDDIKIQDLKIKFANNLLGYSILLFIFFFITYKKNFELVNKLSIFFLILIFLNSSIFQQSIAKINFHIIFSLILIFFSNSLIKLINNNNRKNKLNFIIASSLLLISLETAIVVILFGFFFLFYDNIKNKNSILNNFSILFLIFIIAFIFWPANLFNLTIFKTYLMYFYRFIFENANEYSDLDLIIFFKAVFYSNLILIISLFFVFLFNFRILLKKHTYKNIYLLLALIYFCFIIFFAHNVSYIFPSLVLFIFFTTKVIVDSFFLKKYILLILFSLFIITFSSNISKYATYQINNTNIEKLVNDINSLKINNPKILADGAHIIHYYSHFNYILNLDLYDKHNPKFYTKLNNTYYDLSYLLNNKFFDIIIIKKNRFFTLKELNNFYLLGYKLINNQNYHILFIK